jgi:chromosome segregation ATPase
LLIHRLEVEEGFLNGLDVTFSPHLNVIIGPRGCGKTSIIELIRHCLGLPAATEEAAKKAREHALSVLRSGRVTVTLESEDGQEVKVTRSAHEPAPRYSGPFLRPQVYSQNEIETVGLEARGRLRILDGFVKEAGAETELQQPAIEEEIRSLTSEIGEILRQIDMEEEKTADLDSAREHLQQAMADQEELLKSVTEAVEDRQKLSTLGARVGHASIRQEVTDQAARNIEVWHDSVSQLLRRSPEIPTWPEAAGGEDLLRTARERLSSVLSALRNESVHLREIGEQLKEKAAELGVERIELEDQSRDLRRRLEELQEGAGAAALRVSDLQERVAQLEASLSRTEDLRNRLKRAQRQRSALLDDLERFRSQRFRGRKDAAKTVNAELGPAIEVRVQQGGSDKDYANAVREGLRGSGIHYNQLAPLIAEKMSPRELIEAIETADAELLSRVLETTLGRAQRIVSELRTADLGKILAMPVDDSVQMLLLDGQYYKPTPELSMGQRCTVVLSTLLAQEGPPLLVDQPEDHLDNAYIVDTLVESVLQTKSERQLILATHNPNIPVLGEAETVIHLGSDGKRGFVRSAGPVDDPVSVTAITTVMEGGEAAFARRAEFYSRRRH